MVTNESLEKACSEVSEYSDETMVGEFDRFFREQPAICDFIVELTHESGPKIQELSLFLSYMVFKAMEMGNPSVSSVTADDMEAAYHACEAWMEQISHGDSQLPTAVAESLQSEAEPHLLRYVISELNEPLEEDDELEDEEKGEVFFVLKTVIASLTHRIRREA
jgi:hypothetical protein